MHRRTVWHLSQKIRLVHLKNPPSSKHWHLYIRQLQIKASMCFLIIVNNLVEVKFIGTTKALVVWFWKFLSTDKSLIILMLYFFKSFFGIFPETMRIFGEFVLLAFLMIYSNVAKKYTHLDIYISYFRLNRKHLNISRTLIKYLGKHKKYEKVCVWDTKRHMSCNALVYLSLTLRISLKFVIAVLYHLWLYIAAMLKYIFLYYISLRFLLHFR